MRLEENPSKSVDSPSEKTVVKERILEKIDLSKGISFRLCVNCFVVFCSGKQWRTFTQLLVTSRANALVCTNIVVVISLAADATSSRYSASDLTCERNQLLKALQETRVQIHSLTGELRTPVAK